ELVHSNKSKELSKFVIWYKDEAGKDCVRFDSHPELPATACPPFPITRKMAIIASCDYRPELLERLNRGDVIKPAMYWLQYEVNARLKDLGAVPRLLWDHPRRHQKLGLCIAPASLLCA